MHLELREALRYHAFNSCSSVLVLSTVPKAIKNPLPSSADILGAQAMISQQLLDSIAPSRATTLFSAQNSIENEEEA